MKWTVSGMEHVTHVCEHIYPVKTVFSPVGTPGPAEQSHSVPLPEAWPPPPCFLPLDVPVVGLSRAENLRLLCLFSVWLLSVGTLV